MNSLNFFLGGEGGWSASMALISSCNFFFLGLILWLFFFFFLDHVLFMLVEQGEKVEVVGNVKD